MHEQKIKCLIVDDEPMAREIIESFVAQITSLELVASCEKAFDALKIMQQQPIDLLFSDIQMPNINGLELVKSLSNPPVIIFITAFDNFAIESFELNITDYLLKPISYDRFLKAVNKAISQIKTLKKETTNTSETLPLSYFFVKADNKLNKVLLADILYIESNKDYIKIHVGNSYLVVHSSMKAIEEKLPTDKFFRIHKSSLLAIQHVKSIKGNTVELSNGVSLTIAKVRKEELYKALNIAEGN